ncbi:hypothetical protein FSP39_023898 [Pinctada imbricata]|uniref:Reelin domain-containing protein n=1 Tax=Pinctada imbricata TaxID=66713 RepID=A0AA89C8G5_PINIB|nr:hypothetical protein FSP39_023898 [Pinctada imbricata]
MNETCFFFFLAFLASGFPSGAPTDACFSMIPRHMDPVTNNQVLSQNSNSSFDISVDKSNFEIGEAVKVTIYGPPFKGLFLVAVKDKSNNMPSGRFYHENDLVKTISCSNKNDGITHTSDKWKDSVEVKWYGPDHSNIDEIHFR